MQENLFDVYPSMLRKSVLFPTRGNHETATSGGVAWHFRNHTMPTGGEAGGVPSGTEAYYAFDYGNIHFVCLDSFDSNRSSRGAMATWLRNDLEANTQTWTIAYWHHPPYSKGSHDSDTESELVEMRAELQPDPRGGRRRPGARAATATRTSGRSSSTDTTGSRTTSTRTSTWCRGATGARAATAPTGRPGPRRPPTRARSTWWPAARGRPKGATWTIRPCSCRSSELGSVVLDIDGNRLQARFLRETGEVDDTFTIIKGGGAAATTTFNRSP